MDTDFYAPDLTLIVEADQADMDRLAQAMDQLDADSEDLGDLAAQFAPMLQKMPGNRGVAVARKVKRANKGRQRMSRIMRRMLQRKQARMQACQAHKVPRRSPVTREDVVGRVQTPTPLYAVLTLKQGVLSDSIRSMSGQAVRSLKAFHKGIDDPGSSYGSDVPIDRHRTNLITGGALPDGNTFIGHGIEIDVQAADRSEPNAADLRVIGEALVRWGDRNGSSMISLARIAECPPTTGILTAAGGGNELGVRFAGPPFRSPTPLFSLKGGEKGHEMQLEFPDPDLELTKAYNIRISLRGKHYQKPTGS